MANQMDQTNMYKVLEDEIAEQTVGEVQISNEVVASVAGLAAMEAQGVHSMAGNITNEIVGKFGVKNLAKGVKVAVEGKDVKVEMSINVKYNYNIPKTSRTVQDKVKQAIENMTGLNVLHVNVRVAGVCMENDACTGNS